MVQEITAIGRICRKIQECLQKEAFIVRCGFDHEIHRDFSNVILFLKVSDPFAFTKFTTLPMYLDLRYILFSVLASIAQSSLHSNNKMNVNWNHGTISKV